MSTKIIQMQNPWVLNTIKLQCFILIVSDSFWATFSIFNRIHWKYWDPNCKYFVHAICRDRGTFSHWTQNWPHKISEWMYVFYIYPISGSWIAYHWHKWEKYLPFLTSILNISSLRTETILVKRRVFIWSFQECGNYRFCWWSVCLKSKPQSTKSSLGMNYPSIGPTTRSKTRPLSLVNTFRKTICRWDWTDGRINCLLRFRGNFLF